MGERGVEPIEGALGAGRARRLQGARGAERPSIEARIEHRDLGAGRRDAIPVAARHPLDEAMQPQASEVVGHRARRIGVGLSTLELRDVIAQLPMPKAGGGEREQTERVHERVHARVAEAETGGALILDEDGGRDGAEAVLADQAVVAQRFDV